MGQWMKQYGEALLGSKPGPVQNQETYRTTTKEDAVYVLVLHWPQDGTLRLPSLPLSRASLVGEANGDLSVQHAPGELVIHMPAEAPNLHCSVVRLT